MSRWQGKSVEAVGAWVILFAALGGGCATLDAGAESEPKQSPAATAAADETGVDAKLQACYANARRQQPELSVHTVALYFARDGKVVYADVELPESPPLARCLADGMLGSQPFAGPFPSAVGAVASGARRIDFGAPLTTPVRPPSLAEVRARYRRMTLQALRQGALRESDALVREMLNPRPAWPTAEMRSQLDACYRDASPSHPGLVVHREVVYVGRGDKVLLADVSIPEAPELQRCVLERVNHWSSPFGSASETVLSSFFIDLGGPEEFPDRPVDLAAERARRRALVDRALALGLIAADDPLRLRVDTAIPDVTPGSGASETAKPAFSD